MRDTWYSDNRDIVKWSAVSALVRQHKVRAVIQALFLQPGERPQLSRDGQHLAIPDSVWQHFRNVRAVESLGPAFGCQVHVFDEPYGPRVRREYIAKLEKRIVRLPSPKLVLLDPDTGLQPTHLTSRHVAIEDARRLWRTLEPSDWLTIYQHASREKGWRDRTTALFRSACRDAAVSVFVGHRLAHDVIVLAGQRRPVAAA